MNLRNLIFACVVAVMPFGAVPVSAQSTAAGAGPDCYLPMQAAGASADARCSVLLYVPALVGAWRHTASVAPCNTTIPPREIQAMILYNAGGTASSYGTAPPATQGPSFGVWSQVGRQRYSARLLYYRFNADGSFDGVQDISKDIQLSADGNHATETLDVHVLNADGSLRAHACGTAQDERIDLDRG